MSPPLYRFAELGRMLLGVEPASWLIEIILRITVLYVMLVLSMRLMGTRMTSQLTRIELLALVSLAGAAGPAAEDPLRGLLPPFVCAAIIVLVQRLHARSTVHSERVESFLHGEPSLLVREGRIDVQALRASGISRARLFAQLRAAGFTQLGAVECVYHEPNGAVCALACKRPQPGLSLIPDWDPELLSAQPKREDVRVCAECGGAISDAGLSAPCSHCGRRGSVPAIPPA